jgi:hypothetical protein
MWVIAEYEATTLFTLKPAMATASGGRTLLVPTPFAIKMALLDAACRLEGQSAGAAAWESWLRGLVVALRPAPTVVVNNTFIKVLKPRRNPAEPGSQDEGFFQRTIAYREYACLAGTFAIALSGDDVDTEQAGRWLLNLNYLGKRGSFIQLVQPPILVDDLPNDFIVIDGQIRPFDLAALLTQLDDVDENVRFEQVNIYSDSPLRLGRDRLLRHVVLPYRLVSSSRGYSYYRMNE